MDSIFIFIGVECTQLLFQNGPIFCHKHGLFLRKSKNIFFIKTGYAFQRL